MNTVSIVEQEIATLPNHWRAEVLDFVQFVKQCHGFAMPQGAASSVLGMTDFLSVDLTLG